MLVSTMLCRRIYNFQGKERYIGNLDIRCRQLQSRRSYWGRSAIKLDSNPLPKSTFCYQSLFFLSRTSGLQVEDLTILQLTYLSPGTPFRIDLLFHHIRGRSTISEFLYF